MTERYKDKCVCSATDKAALLEDVVLSLCGRLPGEGSDARARLLADTARGVVHNCARADVAAGIGRDGIAAREAYLQDRVPNVGVSVVSPNARRTAIA